MAKAEVPKTFLVNRDFFEQLEYQDEKEKG